MTEYLKETFFFDYSSPEIQAIIQEFNDKNKSSEDKAVGLYYKIRDEWYYNAYKISFNPEKLKASELVKKPDGHCIDKSILLVAGLRGLGIPARLHLAKVQNHIAVERLTEKFGTNILTPHGMVDVFLNDEWIKISPAFNKELCHKCNVEPLEFDGKKDSLFQAYDKENNLFMEYLDDYGTFEDVPVQFIVDNMKEHYPELFAEMGEDQEFHL